MLGDGIRVYAPKNLRELYDFLLGKAELPPLEVKPEAARDTEAPLDDFADVQGQFFVKRALEIAAAGGHNLLMVGVPGSGKTMLARRLPSILPPMMRREAGGEKFKRTMIFALAEDLREVLKKKVDVFEIGEVNPDSNFYKRIMKEKVLVA